MLDPAESKIGLDRIAGEQFKRKRIYVLPEDTANLHQSKTMRDIASMTRSQFPGWNRIAMVSENELVKGLVKVYSAYRDDEDTKTMWFPTLEEAKEWMASQIPPEEKRT